MDWGFPSRIRALPPQGEENSTEDILRQIHQEEEKLYQGFDPRITWGSLLVLLGLILIALGTWLLTSP